MGGFRDIEGELILLLLFPLLPQILLGIIYELNQ